MYLGGLLVADKADPEQADPAIVVTNEVLIDVIGGSSEVLLQHSSVLPCSIVLQCSSTDKTTWQVVLFYSS